MKKLHVRVCSILNLEQNCSFLSSCAVNNTIEIGADAFEEWKARGSVGVKDARDGKVARKLAVSLATPYMAPTDITHNEATSLFLNMLFTRLTIKSFKGDSSVDASGREK